MKVILHVIAIASLVLCEVPPPYPSRGFRPSPPFDLPTQFSSNQVRQPQRTYTAPSSTPPQILLPAAPQTQYGVPSNVPNLAPSSNSKQTIPRTSYGVPITDNGGSLRNNLRIVNNQLQNRPQSQYGVPNIRDIETLEQIRRLNLLLQSRQISQLNQRNQLGTAFSKSQNSNREAVPTTQYLPQREPSSFRAGGDQSRNIDFFLQSQNSNRNTGQSAVQYLPSREIAHFQLTSSEPNTPNQNIQNFNQNVQQLSQPLHFLPVKEASNFRQGFQLPEPGSPQRINPDISNTNVDSSNRFPQDGVTSNQVQPAQPQDFNTNIPVSSTQYVPSDRPTSTDPNNSGISNQHIPQLNLPTNQCQPANINDILSRPNTNSNSFGQDNQQNSFDIQPADVRKLEPPTRNSVNRFQSLPQNLATTVIPLEENKSFVGVKSKTTSREPGQTYLVPTTTARSINKQLGRPNFGSTTTEAPLEDKHESAESEGEAGGPNIAIATAVSGHPAGQDFYLLQPDGRLQRVLYQKIREVGDQENEYTANYLFQNIQPDSNLVYSPLITLGK